MKKRKKTILGIAFLILIIFFSKRPKKEKFNLPEYSGKSVTYILIDGLEKQRFLNLLQNDQLPTIKNAIHSGLYVQNGIGSFPSMTGYAFYPFLSGVDASKSGIMGLRWLDRSRKNGQFRNYVGRSNIHMNHDLDNAHPTLFQDYDKYYTASVNSYMTKGVKDEVKTGWAMTTSKYQNQSIVTFIKSIPYFGEKWTYSHFEHESLVHQKAMGQIELNPPVQWVTFASPDAYAHINGMDDNYDKIVMHIDSLIESLIQKSKSLNQHRYFAIITDHGLENLEKNIQIENDLKKDTDITLKRGDSTNLLFSNLNDNIEKDNQDGYFVINGNLLASIYLRNAADRSWKTRNHESQLMNYKGVNLIDYFASHQDVEMVFYTIDSTTMGISNQNGRAIIKKKDSTYQYKIIDSDPFRYKETDSIINLDSFYTKEEWLHLTYQQKYPDAVYRAYEFVNNKRAGDLILCSTEGVDFAKNYEILVKNYKGGHGGLRSSMINVPYILIGPDIKTDTLNYLRSEELGQKIKSYLSDN